jgi:hypothetical protein
MARFAPTGAVEVPGLAHSVASLSWGVLRGARGPSDGSVGALSNVPSALAVLRHAAIYIELPAEIDEAFVVLEHHVMLGDQLYPVAVAALPFLLDTLRRGSPIGGRIAELVARYAVASSSLEPPLRVRFHQLLGDSAVQIAGWLGRYDRAAAAIAVHVPNVREAFFAAAGQADRLAPEVLLALAELGATPGRATELALATLGGADATGAARMCAATYLARLPEGSNATRAIDEALPPLAAAMLRRYVGGLWTPTVERPVVAPTIVDAEVVFTGAKLVLVRAGTRSVTLPWAGAAVARGDRLKVGLTTHGQPKLAMLTRPDGTVRVIDF